MTDWLPLATLVLAGVVFYLAGYRAGKRRGLRQGTIIGAKHNMTRFIAVARQHERELAASVDIRDGMVALFG